MAKFNKERLEALLATYDRTKVSFDATMVNGLRADLDKMLKGIAKDAGSDWGKPPEVIQDEVPDPPAIPVTEPGDLWILGAGGHRILCGDCTKADDVTRVLAGSKATVCFTDPPYGVSVGAKNRLLNSVQPSGRNLTDVVDDDLAPEELEAQLRPAFELVREQAMADDCTVFVCSPQGCGLSMMMKMMQNAGLKARHIMIWVKNQPTFSMGRLDYDYQHEPILLTWLARHKRPMQGQHRTSVWEIDKPRASPEHPTMKPVALYVNAYLNNSDAGDVVYDPYCGSGTCIVAAAQTGRRAIAMEIAPNYVDVAIQRWSTFAGGQEPILESTGETFTQVRDRRTAERAARGAEQPSDPQEPGPTIPAPQPKAPKGKKKR
jgi:DNA modification methylase